MKIRILSTWRGLFYASLLVWTRGPCILTSCRCYSIFKCPLDGAGFLRPSRPGGTDRWSTERSSTSVILLGLTPKRMRSVFFLLLSLLVLTMFFPEVGGRLEGTLIAFLDLAEEVLTQASAAT